MSALAAVSHIDFIDVVHQFQSFFLSDMLVKSTAEIIRNIIFTVRKRSGASEAAHNRAMLASYTAFYFNTVDRAMSLFKRISGLEYSNLEFGIKLHKFVCGVDTAGACSDDYYIIFHLITEVLSYIIVVCFC